MPVGWREVAFVLDGQRTSVHCWRMKKLTKPRGLRSEPSQPGRSEPLPRDFNRRTLGQMLFVAARLFDAKAQARVNREAGRTVFRPAHARLMPYLGPEGIRLTDLAKKVDSSKQAVQQVLAELAELGVVESIPDPSDGRARLVRLSAQGMIALSHGIGILQGIEAELRDKLGEKRMGALRDGLAALLDALEQDPTPDDDTQTG